MTDRAIRNLAHLRRSASSARVLNLLKVFEDSAADPDWRERPLFRSPALNRALIIKHRLRRDEMDAFAHRRQVATKVVIPIDADELKSGGRFVFVDQRGFERQMQDAFAIGPGHPDLLTLRLMDRLPSLDPFLLRELLSRNGVDAAACYFAISEADMARMTAFVEAEIRPLVTLSLSDDLEAVGSTRKMAAKLLSSDPRDRMEALRQTLRLEPDEYQEGVFCWKGFLYYKWVLTSLTDEVAGVADAVSSVRPLGKPDKAAKAYLDDSRAVLGRRILAVCQEVEATLAIYDQAYQGLMTAGGAGAFRDFLRDAPRLFARLGEQLGAVQHVVSFWRFRFSRGAAPVGVEELIDIFMDFQTGLAERDDARTVILAA